MLIRPVVETDFPAIAALTNTYILETAVHFGYDAVTPEELAQSWIKNAERYPYFVAEDLGDFAGYAKAGVWRERTAYSWIAEVGIYVVPNMHRRGIGCALYSRLLDTLRDQGFHSAIGGITLPNEASIKLHERMGFEHVGSVRQAGWKFDTWHDVAFYQALLLPKDHVAQPIGPPAIARLA